MSTPVAPAAAPLRTTHAPLQPPPHPVPLITAFSPTDNRFRLSYDASERYRTASDKMSEYTHILANEPSVGLFRVREHVLKTVPQLVQVKKTARHEAVKIEKYTSDVEFCRMSVNSIADQSGKIRSMHDLLHRAAQLAQRIRERELGVIQLQPQRTSSASRPAAAASTATPVGSSDSLPTALPTTFNKHVSTTSTTSSSNTGDADADTVVESDAQPTGGSTETEIGDPLAEPTVLTSTSDALQLARRSSKRASKRSSGIHFKTF